MSGRLQDRVAVVTGAGRGNGFAIARGFAREGAEVVIAELDPARGEQAAREIAAETGRATLAVATDVSSSASVRTLVERCYAWRGRTDVLVNNAGIITRAHFLDLVEEDFDRVIAVNLKGTFLCTQLFAREMLKAQRGAIINISSVSSVMGHARSTNYAASKGGVKMLTRSTAVALAPYGVRVNAIAPGTIVTDLNRTSRLAEPNEARKSLMRVPLGRLGTPEDLVGAAVYLASDESAWVTGTTLFIDGGKLALNGVMEISEAAEPPLAQAAESSSKSSTQH